MNSLAEATVVSWIAAISVPVYLAASNCRLVGNDVYRAPFHPAIDVGTSASAAEIFHDARHLPSVRVAIEDVARRACVHRSYPVENAAALFSYPVQEISDDDPFVVAVLYDGHDPLAIDDAFAVTLVAIYANATDCDYAVTVMTVDGTFQRHHRHVHLSPMMNPRHH